MLGRHAMVCSRPAAASTARSNGVVTPQAHPAARSPPPRIVHRQRGARLRVRASGEQQPDDDDAPSDADTASDFKRELQRRGITAAQTEQLKAKQPAGSDAQPVSGQPDTSRPRGRGGAVPPRWASDTPESLAQSRALGAEGLEGLIPRATQLLRLAFGFWIPFWPFMAVFSALFTLTYVLFGDFFLHSGDYFEPDAVLNNGQAGEAARRPRGPPAYVVPEALLAEPTYDRMVPFNTPDVAQQ